MRQYYDRLIKVKRLKEISGNKRGYVATATADCCIQPLGKEGEEVKDGLFGRTFVCYLDIATPVQKGWRVQDYDGTVYDVTEMVERDWGAFPYKELILKKA